jgi:hypothetical protein
MLLESLKEEWIGWRLKVSAATDLQNPGLSAKSGKVDTT